MKLIKLLLSTALIVATTSLTAFAGQWKQDNIGWWYQNDDNSYSKATWQEIDRKWYYFDDSGYMAANRWIGNYYLGNDGVMLTDTTTPDGYKVGADGIWMQNESRSTATDNRNDSNGLIAAISRTKFDGYTVIVNTHTKKYHLPGCKEAKKIADRNIGYSNDIAALEAAGYEACKVCHK